MSGHTKTGLIIRPGVALVFTLCLAPGFSFAQSTGYQVPRTAGDVPDLQGMWTNNTITPMSRSAEFGDKLVLTAAEAQELEQAVADFTAEQDLPSDPDREAPNKGSIDLADSYNNFWFDDGAEVARYNGEYRSSLIVDPPNGRMPELTLAGQERSRLEFLKFDSDGDAFDDPEARPLAERCLLSFGSSGGPPMLPILYNNTYQIVQSPGYVMILVEMVHDVRIIRIDADPMPAEHQRWLGDSIGRWEGDTLVVETSNFNPSQSFQGSAEKFNVTERFTRVSEDVINYRFTVSDPDTFLQDWSAEIPMNRSEDRHYEYACHEGNYSLPGVLAGARLDEAEAQE